MDPEKHSRLERQIYDLARDDIWFWVRRPVEEHIGFGLFGLRPPAKKTEIANRVYVSGHDCLRPIRELVAAQAKEDSDGSSLL